MFNKNLLIQDINENKYGILYGRNGHNEIFYFPELLKATKTNIIKIFELCKTMKTGVINLVLNNELMKVYYDNFNFIKSRYNLKIRVYDFYNLLYSSLKHIQTPHIKLVDTTIQYNELSKMSLSKDVHLANTGIEGFYIHYAKPSESKIIVYVDRENPTYKHCIF
jgi:hypothetical protein